MQRLRKPHACLYDRFVLGLSRPCWHHTDGVVCCHFAIAAIDFRIVKRGLVDPALEIVRFMCPAPLCG